MIKNNSVFDYFAQIMIIWGVSILGLCLFCPMFGEFGREYSSLFQMGNAGIPIAALMQFFLLAIMIASLRWLFFTDVCIKHLSILWRSILMFICVIVAVGLLAAAFQWFPVNQVMPWIAFLLCFFVCASISVIVFVIKEKMDNQKMQEALERLKGEES